MHYYYDGINFNVPFTCSICGKEFKNKVEYIKHTNFSNNIKVMFHITKDLDYPDKVKGLVNEFFNSAERRKYYKEEHLEYLECFKHYRDADSQLISEVADKIEEEINNIDYNVGFKPGNIVRIIIDNIKGDHTKWLANHIGSPCIVQYSYGERYDNGRCYGGYSIISLKTGEETSWWDEDCLELVEEGSVQLLYDTIKKFRLTF